MAEDTQNEITPEAPAKPQPSSAQAEGVTEPAPAEIPPADDSPARQAPSSAQPEPAPGQPVNDTNAPTSEEPSPLPAEQSSSAPSAAPSGLNDKFSINITKWKERLQQAMAKRQQRWQARLDKVLALAQSQGAITNQQVKKSLRCTKLTAWRYLKTLERQGKIRRTGGHNIPTYEIIK